MSSSYWDAQPCNVRHSDKPVGSLEYSIEVAQRKYRVEPHIPDFAEFYLAHGQGVLDVGCGIGTDTIEFAMRGARVVAVDTSEESLRIAKLRAFHIGLDVTFTDHIPDAGFFDTIYCFGVLHHVERPDRMLKEMRRVSSLWHTTLKVMVYHRWSWKALRIWLGIDQPEAQAGCPIARTYTRRGARKLLESCGFRVTEMRVEHIFPYEIEAYKRYEYRKLWYWRWMPRPLFRALEKTIGWHLLITAVPA